MDKNYSYVDFLKAVNQSQQTQGADKLLDHIYLDLFLNSIQHMQYEKYLWQQIDIALDQKDEDAFYQLTEELKGLQTTDERQ